MSRDELIARLEAAKADQQRELLIEAFEAFHPYPGPRHYLVTEIDWSWDRMRDRFMRMLDAQAYESAALTLVPEGCLWGAGNEDCTDRPWAWCLPPGKSWDDADNSYAATPALALCIAALKARGA